MKLKLLAFCITLIISFVALFVSTVIVMTIENFTYGAGIAINFWLWATISAILSVPINLLAHKFIKKHDFLEKLNDKKLAQGVMPIAGIVLTTSILFSIFANNPLLIDIANAFMVVSVLALGVSGFVQLNKYYKRLAFDGNVETAMRYVINCGGVYWGGELIGSEMVVFYSSLFKKIHDDDGFWERIVALKGTYDGKKLAEIKAEADSLFEELNLEARVSKDIINIGKAQIESVLPETGFDTLRKLLVEEILPECKKKDTQLIFNDTTGKCLYSDGSWGAYV